jgi:quercetin dioxygenase-like cupin family protein
MKHLASIVLALGLCAVAAPPAFAQHGGGAHTMVLPSDLKWGDVPSLPRGAKIAVIEGPMNQAVPFMIRLKFPKDYQIPAHSHPAVERVTVLSGTFHMGTGDKFDKAKTHALPTGSIAIMQIGTNHFAWVSEETIVQLNGTGPWGINYVNPADDPRKQ